MFRGITTLNLDTKGRLTIPTRYRQTLSELCEGRMVVTIDIEDRCLLLYPMPAWERVESRIQALPNIDRSARRIQRLIIGHAADVDMDASGRLLIPGTLREFAGLEGRIALVGQGQRFEIWDETTWVAQRDVWLEADETKGLASELEELSL